MKAKIFPTSDVELLSLVHRSSIYQRVLFVLFDKLKAVIKEKEVMAKTLNKNSIYVNASSNDYC